MMGEQRTLTSVDLFAGCGGLTRGLEGAKFRCVAFNEVNVNAAASFQANFPDAIPFVGNIVDVLSNDIIKNIGEYHKYCINSSINFSIRKYWPFHC